MFPQKCENSVKNMKYHFFGDKLQFLKVKKMEKLATF
jgi:hypothetical protein